MKKLPFRESGRRGSNSRPQPWEGCTLPTELLPQLLGVELTTQQVKNATQLALRLGVDENKII